MALIWLRGTVIAGFLALSALAHAAKTVLSTVAERSSFIKTGRYDREETHEPPAWSLFVPINQPKARLVKAFLEPQAPDSLLAWGEFNLAFIRQEYMEPYVAEQVARDQLASNPDLRKEFEKRLSKDPEFAASPQERLDFFYRRHSAWDERVGRYPIVRLDALP